MNKKKCSVCKKEKSFHHFYKCKSRKDGRQYSCKKCQGDTNKKNFLKKEFHIGYFRKIRLFGVYSYGVFLGYYKTKKACELVISKRKLNKKLEQLKATNIPNHEYLENDYWDSCLLYTSPSPRD